MSDAVPPSSLDSAMLAVIAPRLAPGGVAIEGLRRLSGGASQETWSFDLVTADGSVVHASERRIHYSVTGEEHEATRKRYNVY